MKTQDVAIRLVSGSSGAEEYPLPKHLQDAQTSSPPRTSVESETDKSTTSSTASYVVPRKPLRQPPPPPHWESPGSHANKPPNLTSLPSSKAIVPDQNRIDSPRIVLSPDTENQNLPKARHASSGSEASARSGASSLEKALPEPTEPAELMAELHYHHRPLSEAYIKGSSGRRSSQNLSPGPDVAFRNRNSLSALSNLRPVSSSSSIASDSRRRSDSLGHSRAQTLSPASAGYTRRSPDTRPLSYVDLLNVPYPQPAPSPLNITSAHLKGSVGNNASLLNPLKSLEMYRANVKKTSDLGVQYSFALFMLETAEKVVRDPQSFASSDGQEGVPSPPELVKEARQILQKLASNSYPFAQYYLADGYASGLFNKGKEDNDRAFPLFVSASKRGHVEAAYRSALSYEFGWGTRKDPLKALQFYRQASSKNHPGAMTRLARACLTGDLGLEVRYREGIKWLKRATESADHQYNTAPYELGLLHETGYGDDVFLDVKYAAELFTDAAALGNLEANHKLGDAYEHGKLGLPKDPSLSIHFYNGAASRGYAPAMMALCAWFMVGAEPVLERNEDEAYEWARKAAETGRLD